MPYQQMEASATCCAGPLRTHVEKGAFVIAVIGMVWSVVLAILAPFRPIGMLAVLGIEMCHLITFAVCLFIVIAQRKRNAAYYMPYLIYMGIALVCTSLTIVGLVVLTIAAPQSLIDEFNKVYPELKLDVHKFRLILGFGALFYALATAFWAWVYSIVYRAYKYIKAGQSDAGPSV